MFVNAEQTTKILSILATSVYLPCLITSIGKVPCRMVYLLFNIPIMCSTCTLSFDNSFECSTSCESSGYNLLPKNCLAETAIQS